LLETIVWINLTESEARMTASTLRTRRTSEAGADTRERILDTAERLFAERGYSSVSTRQIADEAQANVAAAHYHFGSKEALLEAVFKRRLDGLNAERERLLQQCMRDSGGHPSAEDVLRAFIGPTLRMSGSQGEQNFKLLAGRASTDPSPEVKRIVFDVYNSVGRSFIETITAACPDLSKQELFWRVACVYGAMMYIRADNGRLEHIFGPDFSLSDIDGALAYAIPFLANGMTAPPVDRAKTAKRGAGTTPKKVKDRKPQ
jgi:AcrR family transcriptional regulator